MTNIQSNNVSFGSRFVPTEPLRKMFYDSASGYFNNNTKRGIINAIESLLNDGKDDVIEISGKRFDKEVIARINGRKIASSIIIGEDFPALGYSVVESICALARKRSKNIDLQQRLDFEDAIILNLKKKLVNYICKEENSLKDASEYAQKINGTAYDTIRAGLNNKLGKIAEQLFGEDCYRKSFADFD